MSRAAALAVISAFYRRCIGEGCRYDRVTAESIEVYLESLSSEPGERQ